eukprot:g2295.t1
MNTKTATGMRAALALVEAPVEATRWALFDNSRATRFWREVERVYDMGATQALMAAALGLALFGVDVYDAVSVPDEHLQGLWVALTVTFVLFVLEIVTCLHCKRGYAWSFFLFADVLGTASLLFEVPWLNPLGSMHGDAGEVGGGGGEGEEGVLLRSSRTARAGAQYGRLVRLVRVARTLKAFKLVRLCLCLDCIYRRNLRRAGAGVAGAPARHHHAPRHGVSHGFSALLSRRSALLVLTSVLVTAIIMQQHEDASLARYAALYTLAAPRDTARAPLPALEAIGEAFAFLEPTDMRAYRLRLAPGGWQGTTTAATAATASPYDFRWHVAHAVGSGAAVCCGGVCADVYHNGSRAVLSNDTLACGAAGHAVARRAHNFTLIYAHTDGHDSVLFCDARRAVERGAAMNIVLVVFVIIMLVGSSQLLHHIVHVHVVLPIEQLFVHVQQALEGSGVELEARSRRDSIDVAGGRVPDKSDDTEGTLGQLDRMVRVLGRVVDKNPSERAKNLLDKYEDMSWETKAWLQKEFTDAGETAEAQADPAVLLAEMETRYANDGEVDMVSTGSGVGHRRASSLLNVDLNETLDGDDGKVRLKKRQRHSLGAADIEAAMKDSVVSGEATPSAMQRSQTHRTLGETPRVKSPGEAAAAADGSGTTTVPSTLASRQTVAHKATIEQELRLASDEFTRHSKLGTFDFCALDFVHEPALLNQQADIVFECCGVWSAFAVPRTTAAIFVDAVLDGYRDNPYHNRYHAVDVLNTFYTMMLRVSAHRILQGVDIFAGLVASLGHDLGHTGETNSFLTSTRAELALRYNDASPLENMHASSLYELMRRDGGRADVCRDLSREQWATMRKTVINAILATDMTAHFKMVGEIEKFYELNKGDLSALHRSMEASRMPSTGQPQFLRNDSQPSVLGSANGTPRSDGGSSDVSTPLSRVQVIEKWTPLVMQEFFEQGDREKAFGLTPLEMNDRDRAEPSKCQIGFIEFVVGPLFFKLIKVFPRLYPLGESLVSKQ